MPREPDTGIVGDARFRWRCTFCNHIVFGTEEPKACPLCKHSKGFSAMGDDEDFSLQLRD